VTQTELYNALDYVNHSRHKRLEMANLVLEQPDLIQPLLAIAFTVNDPISSKACWVMEFAATHQLAYIYPYLNEFTSGLGKLHLDSSVRPIAKICEHLVVAFFSRTANEAQQYMKEEHLERITTACFDWLIGDHKVAAKAYSMTALYLLGKKYSWIHPELQMVLEQNYAQGSAAYKARARRTLAKLK